MAGAAAEDAEAEYIRKITETEVVTGQWMLELSQPQKATIHQLTTMLPTSENVLVPGHNKLLTTSADDLTL